MFSKTQAVPFANVENHVGKSMTAIDLLYSMMVPSGNDAAMVLADYIGEGNVDNFVKLMNEKSKGARL